MNYYVLLVLGFVLAIGLVVAIMPFYIKTLKNHQLNQSVSEYALKEYKNKAKTPIMGGLVFTLVSILSFLFINYKGIYDREVLLCVVSVALYCLVGFLDDILIILRKDNAGLSPSIKLIMELIFTLIINLLFKDILDGNIDIPFINGGIQLPTWIYLILIIMIYAAEANAVNFTDGMDGLCAGVSVIALIPFAVLAFKADNLPLVQYIVCFIGALVGYLFFNWHPAKIFMGDSGSLGLGALFASLGIALDKEIALFVIGGVFVWEMFCVCLQLTWVKLFHKRVFKYTPIHYAFVLKGYREVNIVKMFYLIGIVLGVIGLYIGLN